MFYNFSLDINNTKMFKEMGINLELMLREADIPPRAVENGKYQLTAEQYKAFMKSMDKHMDADIMLAMSISDNMPTFVPEFFAGLCADSGLNCIKRISKYKKIVAPVNMDVTYGTDTVSVSYKYNDGDILPRGLIMNAQISLLSIIRQGAGMQDIKPVKMSAEYEYPQKAVEYIGIQPMHGDNEIVFSNEDLAIPFITENNRMWDYLEGELNQRLKEMEVDNSFSALVRKTLFELVPGGVSDAEKVSYELGVSRRTLQRKLKDENTTFNQQLNHTRELLVRNYLKTNMTLDEIAFLVNYSDAKSLSRAFKIWTGMSVSEYKKGYA